jgi:hypothetical protein
MRSPTSCAEEQQTVPPFRHAGQVGIEQKKLDLRNPWLCSSIPCDMVAMYYRLVLPYDALYRTTKCVKTVWPKYSPAYEI